jgi:hypothetical protein
MKYNAILISLITFNHEILKGPQNFVVAHPTWLWPWVDIV